MLTKSQTSTLTEILVLSDGLWLPFRCFPENGRAATAIRERRSGFMRNGVPYAVTGSVAERKAGERELQRMASDGLITIFRRRKRVGVALTTRGDDVARTLVAGYTASESLNLLALVEKVRSTYTNQIKNHYVLEADLFGRSYDAISSPSLVAMENISLALLCRRWLESASDGRGAVGYRVTESGRLAMAAGKSKTGSLPKFDATLADEYDRLFLDSLVERNDWEGESNHVHIPLGCGDWSQKKGTPPYKFQFIESERISRNGEL